eukprot:326190-Pyramimonas_sp.AAC.1
MIQEEGGPSKRVIKGVIKHCTKCIKKGGKHVWWNDSSERLEFRSIKRVRIEERATHWAVGLG